MIKYRSPRLLPAVAAVVLATLASSTASADPASTERRLAALGYTRAEPVNVLPQDVIDHWDYLDNRTVIVHSGAGGHYLVSLASECPALASASLISFNAAITGGLVESGGLVVGASASAPECAIGGIVRLNAKTSG